MAPPRVQSRAAFAHFQTPPLTALFATECERSLSLISDYLEQLGCRSLVCKTITEAEEQIRHAKVDLVVADLRLLGGCGLIRSVRSSRSNARVPIIALQSSSLFGDAAFANGATFVLTDESGPDLVARTLRVACGLTLTQRRRYFRRAAELEVSISVGSARYRAATVNISQEGIALKSEQALPLGATVGLTFSLPGGGEHIAAFGTVIWADPRGVAGLLLKNVSTNGQHQLNEWLGEGLASQLSAYPSSRCLHSWGAA